jgi:hypothetical protein
MPPRTWPALLLVYQVHAPNDSHIVFERKTAAIARFHTSAIQNANRGGL